MITYQSVLQGNLVLSTELITSFARAIIALTKGSVDNTILLCLNYFLVVSVHIILDLTTRNNLKNAETKDNFNIALKSPHTTV